MLASCLIRSAAGVTICAVVTSQSSTNYSVYDGVPGCHASAAMQQATQYGLVGLTSAKMQKEWAAFMFVGSEVVMSSDDRNEAVHVLRENPIVPNVPQQYQLEKATNQPYLIPQLVGFWWRARERLLESQTIPIPILQWTLDTIMVELGGTLPSWI
ncbi:hypothetical protein BDZ91DRAFT_763741 [Kalaharituber pfeilii]|nr:hypothetical protein BDZ91DRAFT_763741 [Kalaharituber pfeilii]